jgi:LCP family protein required for cell wall assembly
MAVGASVWAFRLAKSFVPEGANPLQVWQGISNPKEQFATRRPIILVVGKDYNHDRKGMAYTKDARADTIMLISADLETPKITAVSIPRDTKVTAADGVTGKINGTLQRGGVDLLRQTINLEFGVNVDHYLVLKADAVKEMVNAVGGVNVEPIDDMFYEDRWGGLKVDLKAGPQRITGEQAVGFVRFRKMGDHRVDERGNLIPVRMGSSKEEGDIRRTERQQQLIHALTDEALRPQNILRASELVDTAFRQIETDLSRTQVLALATIFKGGGTSALAGSTIPGEDETDGGIYYWKPDRERAKLTIDWLLQGDEMAGRRLTRVAVYNGTKERRAASHAAESLSSLGYTAFASGRARGEEIVPEVVYRKAAYEEAAKLIAKELNIPAVRKDPSDANAYWLPEIKVTLTDAVIPASNTP